MSRPANPDDNASCESFIKTLKREEIYANQYEDLEHLRANIEEFIDQYYNRQRLHSALGYRSPEEFEQRSDGLAAESWDEPLNWHKFIWALILPSESVSHTGYCS
jgi:putative transposase